MKKVITLSFFSIVLHLCSSAQQTGDFSIGFPSPDTLLTDDSVYIYFHVPAAYQQSVPSKMILGIHGAGNPKTPQAIRNYFSPTGDSLNAIVVCPKPYLGDQPRSELVINLTVDSVLQWYNIDTNEIYIAGYSAGSDVASKYVLENPLHKMKGLIWYAPGFFFKPELSQQTEFPPTCLCFGDQDPISNILGQVTSIRDSFANSPFDFFYNEIPGITHTMEFPNFTREMLECFRFMDNPQSFIPDSSYVGEQTILPQSFGIYPNPSNGKVFFTGANSAVGDLSVTDMLGKTILEKKDFHPNQFINLSGEAPGIYIVSYRTGKENFFTRLILTAD